MKRLITGSLTLFGLAYCVTVRAETPEPREQREPPRPIVDTDSDPWDRVDIGFGFVHGQTNYGRSGCPTPGCVLSPSGTQLIDPFTAPGLNAVDETGLRYEATTVFAPLRMMVGVDLLWPDYRPDEASGLSLLGDEANSVTVVGLDPTLLRLGLGLEHDAGPVVMYADLIGSIRFLDTNLLVDEQLLDVSGRTFELSARGGIRMYVREHLFVATGAQVGFGDSLVWSAEFLFGFSVI